MNNKFLEYYSKEKDVLNNYINDFNKDLIQEENSFLKEVLTSFSNLNSDGKLIRGTLVNLGYSLLKKDYEYSYPLAMAFEVFQTSILIHDDIIDKDNFRRNKPTIHSVVQHKYGDVHLGDSVAICAGDYGFYSSLKIISENYKNDPNLSRVLTYFSDVVLKTIKGELLDIITPYQEQNNKESNSNLEANIMEVYKLKTAYYTIIGPLALGLILAGLENDKLNSIYEFGYNVGLGFQLQDDLLGIYGEDIGKTLGSDIEEFKTTMLYAHTKKNNKYYQELLSVYGKKLNKNSLEKVRDIFQKSGAKKDIEDKIDSYYNNAISLTNNIEWLSDDNKELLVSFVGFLKSRKK